MSVFNKLFHTNKASPKKHLIQYHVISLWQHHRQSKFTERTTIQNPAVYSCVRVFVETKRCIYLRKQVTKRYTFFDFINAVMVRFLAHYFLRSSTVTLSTCPGNLAVQPKTCSEATKSTFLPSLNFLPLISTIGPSRTHLCLMGQFGLCLNKGNIPQIILRYTKPLILHN